MMRTDLHRHVGDYLRLRRSLGFKLVFEGHVLPQFVTWLETTGATTVTAEAAVTWAQLPQGVHPVNWAHRLGAVRGFTRYLRTIDPSVEVPPANVFGRPVCRATPYLFSADEVRRLLGVTGALRPELRASTFETLFGLLATTGLRIGEALRLQHHEVDLDHGVLTIVGPKSGHSRLVPLHPSSIDALRRYVAHRNENRPNTGVVSFFESTPGTALTYSRVLATWRLITTEIGLRTATIKPRIHDLRHSYIINRLVDWYRAGEDPSGRLPVLSTYVGHTNPASTYWYLSAEPELKRLAAIRLDEHIRRDQIGSGS
jgi:integrase/recombinase XerD